VTDVTSGALQQLRVTPCACVLHGALPYTLLQMFQAL
jgi:hypothetical protein